MRFTTLFAAAATVAAVSAAPASPEKPALDTITKDLKNGDFLGAVVDILTLGSCDVGNLAACAAGFAPIVIQCGEAVIAQGADSQKDLECFQHALELLGDGPKGFDKCSACIQEGISIAETILKDI